MAVFFLKVMWITKLEFGEENYEATARKGNTRTDKIMDRRMTVVVAFWILFLTIKVWLVNTKMLISILYPLLVLSLILVQGSIYWWILLRGLSIPQFAVKNTGKIYRILKMADVVLLCLGIPIIIINYSNIFVMILAIFIWLFSVIEWINYYKIRLSYSYNPMILLRHIKNGKLKKSRLAKEIDCVSRKREKH